MLDIGRVCIKIAGRDSGERCVIVDVIDHNFVQIDGATRRRRCNILHLEPMPETLDLKKGASHEEVAQAFKAKSWGFMTTKPKAKAQNQHASAEAVHNLTRR